MGMIAEVAVDDSPTEIGADGNGTAPTDETAETAATLDDSVVIPLGASVATDEALVCTPSTEEVALSGLAP